MVVVVVVVVVEIVLVVVDWSVHIPQLLFIFLSFIFFSLIASLWSPFVPPHLFTSLPISLSSSDIHVHVPVPRVFSLFLSLNLHKSRTSHLALKSCLLKTKGWRGGKRKPLNPWANAHQDRLFSAKDLITDLDFILRTINWRLLSNKAENSPFSFQ